MTTITETEHARIAGSIAEFWMPLKDGTLPPSGHVVMVAQPSNRKIRILGFGTNGDGQAYLLSSGTEKIPQADWEKLGLTHWLAMPAIPATPK